ncbi:unnamed protein product [Adineta steineri]|uniref:Uncharacterized protein n=2 Tax=Adineta steineri TaxID=433720 RepID=A0A818IHM9_9BILA|nr:unnamed protein product [Adineta steineri]CAF3526940.1 unnamed protein product [Adineta steineri]
MNQYNIHSDDVALYTLPLLFQPSMTMSNGYRVDSIISTLPKNFNSDVYPNGFTNIKTLVLLNDPMKFDKNFNQTKIVNLIIERSFTSIDWIRTLTKLRHVSFSKSADISSNIFECLLDHTPELESLVVDNNLLRILTNNYNNVSICNQLSNKIQYLKFHSATNASQCFNKNRLAEILPIFASKCKHLSLSIQSKHDLIALILKRTKRLHSLHVHIKEKDHLPITMQWFDEQKTKSNYSNCFIMKQEQDYYFWLGRHNNI